MGERGPTITVVLCGGPRPAHAEADTKPSSSCAGGLNRGAFKAARARQWSRAHRKAGSWPNVDVAGQSRPGRAFMGRGLRKGKITVSWAAPPLCQFSRIPPSGLENVFAGLGLGIFFRQRLQKRDPASFPPTPTWGRAPRLGPGLQPFS